MAAKIGLNPMQLVVDPWLETSRAVTESCRANPKYADLQHLRGLLHLVLGEGDAAVEAFQEALAVNPGYRKARFGWMAALRLRDGSLDPAVWETEGPIEGQEEPERSLWTAWFLAQRNDREGTRQALRNLAEGEGSALAWFATGCYEQEWGNARAARDAFGAAAKAQPLYRGILQARGWTGTGRRREPGGLEGGDPSSWNPALAELYEYVGTVCARLGRPDEALSYYEEAFLREGRESLHQIRLAHLALARGDEEEAVATLCRAIEVDPTSVPARIALGFEYQSQGYQAEALVQFEVAARLRPRYPDLQYNLGLLYDAQGRSEEALRCLRRALEVNPNYFQARTTLARILLQREDHEEALGELGALFAGGIRSADLYVQKAQAHLALNQVQEAVRELELAVGVNPAYARTYYILGQAYRQLGLRRKARSAWQQYLEHSRSWRERQPAHEEEGWAS